MNIMKFCVWLICAILILNLSFSMLTASDTAINCIGAVIIASAVEVSIRTKCFTSIKIKRNGKES